MVSTKITDNNAAMRESAVRTTTYLFDYIVFGNCYIISEKIASMQQGTEAGLVAIFGDDWEIIGTSGQRKEFGRLFKAAVSNHTYLEIQWVRIENSGRYDVYQKL